MFACGSIAILWGSNGTLRISRGILVGMATAVLVEVGIFPLEAAGLGDVGAERI